MDYYPVCKGLNPNLRREASAPSAQLTGEDITQRRKGAEAQRRRKGFLYVSIACSWQNSYCNNDNLEVLR